MRLPSSCRFSSGCSSWTAIFGGARAKRVRQRRMASRVSRWRRHKCRIAPERRRKMSGHHVTLTVNGEQRTAEVEARTLLVHLLREDFAVTSAHVGCHTTQCGACTVRLDGHAVKSCTVLAVQADGAAIDTIESLSGSGDAEHPLLSAFRGHHALQCGFCTPGMVMSSLELLQRERNPSEERVRAWLKGNFCRCTGYQNIVDAIRAADGASTAHEAEAAGPGFFGRAVWRREDDR